MKSHAAPTLFFARQLKWLWLPAFLAVAFSVTGCATLSRHFGRTESPAPRPPAPTFTPAPVANMELPPLDPSLLQRPASEYKLGPGDELDIEVIGDIATRSRTVVGPDGKIYFYMLPGLDVWGLTLTQTRERIVQGLQQFVREEQPVSVTLRSAGSQRIWLLGRLNQPGVYAMPGPMTLLEAISEAGGPAPAAAFASLGGTVGASPSRGGTDEAADMSRAFVIRQGRLLRVDFQRLLHEGDMAQNIYLQPDDFIYLPSATTGNVHVLGAVNAPRMVDYVSQLSLVQAVAQAGGPLARDAYPSEVAIVRGSLSQPKVAIVDLSAILRGQTADVILEPQDIVYVPYSPFRVLNRYVNTILDTFVRVIGVNEGARAVSGNVTPVSVNVPLGP